MYQLHAKGDKNVHKTPSSVQFRDSFSSKYLRRSKKMCYFAPDFSNMLENFKIAKSLLTF